MKIDPLIIEAINEMCEEEGVPHASNAINRFVERYLSNELPSNSINNPLQDIYNVMKRSTK